MVRIEERPVPVDPDSSSSSSSNNKNKNNRNNPVTTSSTMASPTSCSVITEDAEVLVSDVSTPDATGFTPSSDSSHGVSTTKAQLDRPVIVSTWHSPEPTAVGSTTRPDADEIIRQVEFYFSDNNLRQDAHLLGLSGGDGNGWVGLNEILSFKKMRAFKPPSRVKEILKQSTMLVISDDNKRIKRKYPLTGPIYVKPKVDQDRQKKVVDEDKPWLTKNMLKPTGFEKNTVEGPLTPAQFAEERDVYHPDINISSRLEEAVNRFLRNKRMHSVPANIFTKFMAYGGIECAHREFGGSGLDKKSLRRQGADQAEIDRLTAQYSLSRLVEREFDDQKPNDGKWVVDFTGIAKGFLSSNFPFHFLPYSTQEVHSVCNILRTFYNYLLYHSVCPEYDEDLKEARSICDQAEHELLAITEMAKLLPGEFNNACSTIFTDNFKTSEKGDYVADSFHHEIMMPLRKALTIFATGVCYFGTDAQVDAVVQDQAKHRLQSTGLKIVRKEKLGLRIMGAISSHEVINKTVHFVKPMGIIICERWACPYAAPRDLPAWVYEDEKRRKDFEFLVPEAVIDIMSVGMYFNATVHTLDIGVTFIDHIDIIHTSFFTFLPNEWIRDWKEPGPPTEVQKEKNRQHLIRHGLLDVVKDQQEPQPLEQDEDELVEFLE